MRREDILLWVSFPKWFIFISFLDFSYQFYVFVGCNHQIQWSWRIQCLLGYPFFWTLLFHRWSRMKVWGLSLHRVVEKLKNNPNLYVMSPYWVVVGEDGLRNSRSITSRWIGIAANKCLCCHKTFPTFKTLRCELDSDLLAVLINFEVCVFESFLLSINQTQTIMPPCTKLVCKHLPRIAVKSYNEVSWTNETTFTRINNF